MGLVLHVRAGNSRRAAAASAPLSVLFNGGENASLLVRHCGGRTTTQGRERRPERGRARPPRDSRLRLAPFSSLFLNILALSCTSWCRGPGFVCHRPHRFATLRRLTSPSLAFLVCTRGPGLSPSAESPEFRGEPCGRGVPARGGQSASGAGGRPGQGCGGAVGVSSGHGAIGARPALFRGGGTVWAMFRARCF